MYQHIKSVRTYLTLLNVPKIIYINTLRHEVAYSLSLYEDLLLNLKNVQNVMCTQECTSNGLKRGSSVNCQHQNTRFGSK